ncbi:MAG: M28 family metallopeptidase [Clostridiaceae bacterium]|nr:M28 family metallopeptidase [Clostridiaceae bacterium]
MKFKGVEYSDYYLEAYEHTRYFAEDCGVRVAGGDNVLQASQYIQNQFEEYGIEHFVHKFEIPFCDIKHSELKAQVDGKWVNLKHTPAIFSKTTPETGLQAPLVYIENGSVGNIKQEEVEGKFVLICRDVYIEYPDLNMYKKLHEYGAKGILFTTSDGHKDAPYVYANFAKMQEEYTIPTAIMHYDEAMQLIDRKNVIIQYSFQCDITMKGTQNTIGVVEGTDKAAGNIIVCAHLDSAQGSLGAIDDAGGVAVVMEMAKLYGELKKKGILPKRTIYFIAWSGHECGIYGSRYFIEDNPSIYENNKFVFNYDIIGNVMSSPLIWAGCNQEMAQMLEKVIDKLELEWKIELGPWVVDTINFASREIPHLTLTSGFYSMNHTKYDNMSYVSKESFKTPILFSVEMLDELVNAEEVPQGYDDKLKKEMQEYGNMYGWGFFSEE